MFKLKSETELNFDSREMQKTYFEQTQAYPGYYHQSTPNGYGEYNGQMGYNANTPSRSPLQGKLQYAFWIPRARIIFRKLWTVRLHNAIHIQSTMPQYATEC